MHRNLLICIPLFLCCTGAGAQFVKVYGKVSNARQEPLAFASVQVKQYPHGSITKEDGSYELLLEEGKYDLVISMVGYKTQVMTIIVGRKDLRQDIMLEVADITSLSEVTIKGKFKDHAEEYIRQVIRNKEAIQEASGNYSCTVYIKAVQDDSTGIKKPKGQYWTDSLVKALQKKAEMNQMSMAEIVLKLDREAGRQSKEERTGINKRGNPQNLFYLSTTEGDFNFYNNLVSIPALSSTVFLSPVSYSGLQAYRYKTIKTETLNGHKIYTIAVKPRQLSNATVEGELTVMDSSWVILHSQLRFPGYHLAAYDAFEVEQQFQLVNGQAWMLTRQDFVYSSKTDKRKMTGHTTVYYLDFELNKTFEKNHFGDEVSAASQQAYDQDSLFWKMNRVEPLTEKELRFIHYKDSVFRYTHTEAYLDSVDSVTNRITWFNLVFRGQNLNYHKKGVQWYLPAIPSIYNPFSFGGARLQLSAYYSRVFPSKKMLSVNGDLSYGLRNQDVNGSINIRRLYNPFRRSFYTFTAERDFDFIFSGDAWINMIKRNNIYLKQAIGIGHEQELVNGLYLYLNADAAFRSSVAHYKTNDKVDSLFGNLLDNNQAVAFPSYNAFYGTLQLEYTPHQRYIREPKEKVILGSSWPTFYTQLKKGIPGIMNSNVDFDYLEFGIRQSVKLGVLGISSYSIKSGSFINTRDLRMVDYKFMRRGDPILFQNPNTAFQALDSTFPVFKRFYEGHYVHEFNGALLNKIPFFKKIGLRELAGAGFLVAPERNLRYGEVFAGIERVFRYPFNQLGKFKLGVYVVGSGANQFHNPVQVKIGITTWDKKKGKWF